MATAVTDEWTEEKCIQLIREFRARPVLWDQKDPFFFKKSMKPKAWQEIAETINISADKCKHKMIILMSSFRREKAKIMHSIRDTSDPSQAYRSTWFAFKDLAFLMDKENERKRRLNGLSIDEEDNDDSIPSIKNTLLKHHIGTPIPMKRGRRSLSVSVSVKKEVENVIDLVQDDEVSTRPQSIPGPSQTTAERDEEIKSFTSFIGNKMKKYTDTTKNAVQQAICEVIFKADQNYYELNNGYEKFTIIDDETDPLNRAIYDVQSGTTVIKVENDSDNSD